MRRLTFEPARPVDTDVMPWIPTGAGKSFRPLRFAEDGWSELMRLEPGSAVASGPTAASCANWPPWSISSSCARSSRRSSTWPPWPRPSRPSAAPGHRAR